MVHGDDFTFLGTDEMLDYCQDLMQANFEIKVRGRLGPNGSDDKTIRIQHRCVSRTGDGTLYVSDPRHAEILTCERRDPSTEKRAGHAGGSI